MTEKGKKSEFLVVIGEKAETTHSFYIVPTPLEYWLLTTYPRERWYRQWWLATHPKLSMLESIEQLAEKFPHGISDLAELPEERSGEVSGLGGAPLRVERDGSAATGSARSATSEVIEVTP
jgi:hypothetical protein